MGITPKDPAHFDPAMGDYKDLKPFRMWCQKVLPLVYDESLSYYEVLCKLVDYLNKTMEDVGVLHGDVEALHEAYLLLQAYVNDYFSTLDVQEEINNKLDVMAEDGTLDALLLPYFNTYKTEINGIIDDQNQNISNFQNVVNTNIASQNTRIMNFESNVSGNIATQNQKINVLNARVDQITNLPEGSTSGDAELADIRVSAYGTTYATAGDAVRGQVDILQNQIDTEKYYVSVSATKNILNRFNKATKTSNVRLSVVTGETVEQEGFFASDYIDIRDLSTIKLSYTHVVCFYNASKVFLSGDDANTITNDGGISRPTNAVYMKFSTYDDYLNYAQVGKDVSRDNYINYGLYTLPNYYDEPIKSDIRNLEDQLHHFPVKDIINRFDKTTITADTSLSIINGETTPIEGFFSSDYIEIEDLSSVSGSYTHIICFYDANKTFISGQSFDTISVDSSVNKPAEAVYARFSTYSQYIDTAQLGDNVSRTEYMTFGLYDLPNFNTKPFDDDIAELEKEITYFPVKSIMNRFNKNDIVEGHYVSPVNGQLYENASFFASDYIEIADLPKVKISYTHIQAFYDANKHFISGDGDDSISSDRVLTTPENAVYIRFSSYNEYLNSAQVGDTTISRTNYVSYGMYSLPNYGGYTKPSIVVDVTGGGDYTSLTEALYETVGGGLDVVVKAGIYDIVSEYVSLFGEENVNNMADSDASIFGGFQYGAIIRNRKVTFEEGSHVVCDWTGHTVDGTHRFSALRVDYNAEIIGLDLVSTHTFYAIHDDYGLTNEPYTVKYENCHIEGVDLVNGNCIGGGCKKYSQHIIKNCYINNNTTNSVTVRYHNTNAAGAEPRIYISNTYFNNWLTANWYGSQTTKMRVYVNNCEANRIYKERETASFDVDNVELFKWCNVEHD